MKFSIATRAVGLVFAARACSASPVVSSPIIDLRTRQAGAVDPMILIRQGLDAVKDRPNNSRLETETFSLDRNWKGETLFDGGFQSTTGHVNLSVECLDCHTRGSVGVAIWEDFFQPALEFTFMGAEAYVELGVKATASERIAISLFTSESPIGVGIPGLRAGVYFAIDLILSLATDMDLSGGFWVDFPEHAFLELGIFNGNLDASTFEGTRSGLVPVNVRTAWGRFSASLRIGIQAGVESDNKLIPIGAGALLGVYANVVELIATFEKTETCPLEIEAEYNFNVGAFARLSVALGPTVIGPTPTVSTTLFRAPIVSTCVFSGSAATVSSIEAPAIVTSFVAVTTPIPAITATSSTTTIEDGFMLAPTLTPTATGSSASSAQALPTITSSPVVVGQGCRGKQRARTYTIVRCALDVANCPHGFAEEIVVTGMAPAGRRRHVVGGRAEAQPTHVLAGGVVMTPLPTPIVHTITV